MGDIRLPQFGDEYDRSKMGSMVDTLENALSRISTVFAFTKKGAYQLTSNTTPVGNVTVGVDTLMTYSLQPNVLAKDGYNISIKAWGTFAANANSKQLKLLFGAAVLYDTTALVVNNGTWVIESSVVRTGTATQQAVTFIISSNTTVVNSVTYIVPTETLSGTIVIKCTGEAVATNDIVQKGLLIKVFPQE